MTHSKNLLIELLRNQAPVGFGAVLSRALHSFYQRSKLRILRLQKESKTSQNNPQNRQALNYARGVIYWAISVMIFAGCASLPKNDLAQIIDAPTLNLSTEQALHHSGFKQGQWPDEKWWEMFEDPQLSRLITTALESNFTLKIAHERVESAYQLAKISRSKLFPHLNGNYTEQWQYLSKYGFDRDFFPVPSESKMQIPHTLNLIDLTLNFNYELDFWGKNRNLFYAALGSARAEAAEERQAQLIITIAIAQSYFALQAKQTQKEILIEQLQDKKQLFALSHTRYSNGLIDALDVFSTDKQVHDIQQKILFLDEAIELDKHQLKYLAGLGPDAILLQEMPTARLNSYFPLPENLSSDLLARRADLMAQIWRVEAAAKEIGAAQATFYPNVNLMAFAGLEALSFSHLFADSKTAGLTPAIHLPIFTAGKLRANLRSKLAAFNQAVYLYNDLVLHAAKEVADQVVKVQIAIDALSEQMAAFQDRTAQYNLQFSRYVKGLDNFLGVLNCQTELLEQRFLLTSLQLDHLICVLQLIKSLGGGYCSQANPKSLSELP